MDVRFDAPDSLVGVWILDQYRIIRVLAKGGMSQVYLAEQASMDRYAAIKIVRPAQGPGGEGRPYFENRLRQEARAASRLVHPNIITIFNFGELVDGSVFLAMEYIKGPSLAEVIGQGPLPLPHVLNLASQCAAALSFAHSKGVVHRDFKPGNAILTELEGADLVKVVDFGVARLMDESYQTKEGEFIGTPRYMSPEQCRGELATPLSDQYALGLVIYEMATGASAIASESVVGLLHQHQFHVPAPPSGIRPVPGMDRLDPVVMRMLEKDPAQRFPCMEQVHQALTAAYQEIGPAGSSVALRFRGNDTLVSPPPTRAGQTEARQEPAASISSLPLIVEGTRALLSEEGWLALGRCCRLEEPDGKPATGPTGQPLRVVATSLAGLDALRADLKRRGLPADRTLVCVDSPLEDAPASNLADALENLIVGPFPLEPSFLAGVLSWMAQNGPGGLECFGLGAAVQLLQIKSSAMRSFYVDTLLDDLSGEGVRRPAQRAVAELAEEMILNAIFHAPRDPQGRPLYSHLDRSQELALRAGEEPNFRWLIGRDRVGVSIQDHFGSLEASEVLARVLGRGRQPDLSAKAGGVGLGLYVMSRAAQHLVFAICPRTWCEVVALVPREAATRGLHGRAVCVLQCVGPRVQWIGDRLKLREVEARGTIRLELSGEINETSDLRRLYRGPGRTDVDLSEISRINSVGVRAWLEAARGAPPELELIFHRCAPPIVSQINMTPSLTAHARVESIMAPYYCERCDEEHLVLLLVEEIAGENPPARTCPTCGSELRFDDVPEEYFAFLQ